MSKNDKLDKFLVVPKENQIPMRFEKYNVNFMVELVPLDGQLQINYQFDPNVELTDEQKDEIAAETIEHLKANLGLGE